MISAYIMFQHSTHKLGIESSDGIFGVPCVELDESLFGHFGSDDRVESQLWVFGIYDRGTSEIRIFVVENDRTQEKLIPLIQANVQTQAGSVTRVYTDGFLAYRNLVNYGYDHRVVILILFL